MAEAVEARATRAEKATAQDRQGTADAAREEGKGALAVQAREDAMK